MIIPQYHKERTVVVSRTPNISFASVATLLLKPMFVRVSISIKVHVPHTFSSIAYKPDCRLNIPTDTSIFSVANLFTMNGP